MTDKINLMSIKEFRELGYLQEVNRQFLHKHGLALVTEGADCPAPGCVKEQRKINEDTGKHQLIRPVRNCYLCEGEGLDPAVEETLYGIWDYRDDSEGIAFCWPTWADDEEKQKEVLGKAQRVEAEREKHLSARSKLFQDVYGIEPDFDFTDGIEPYKWWRG